MSLLHAATNIFLVKLLFIVWNKDDSSVNREIVGKITSFRKKNHPQQLDYKYENRIVNRNGFCLSSRFASRIS